MKHKQSFLKIKSQKWRKKKFLVSKKPRSAALVPFETVFGVPGFLRYSPTLGQKTTLNPMVHSIPSRLGPIWRKNGAKQRKCQKWVSTRKISFAISKFGISDLDLLYMFWNYAITSEANWNKNFLLLTSMAQKSVPLAELTKKISVLGLLGIVENVGKV